MKNDLQQVENLIAISPHPCLLDIRNDKCLTALHIAIYLGIVSVVRRLVISGANINAKTRERRTALHIAVENGDLECMLALLSPLNKNELPIQKIIHSPNLEAKNLYGEILF